MKNRTIAPIAPSEVYFAIKESPPYLICGQGRGIRFKVFLDGTTFMLWDGGIEIPAPGCPIPERLFLANVQHFLHRNSDSLIKLALICVLLVCMQFALWSLPGNPMTDLHLSFVDLFCTTINGLLLLWGGIWLARLFARFFPRVTLTREERVDEATLLLSPGELDFGVNTLICCLSEDETPAEFAQRLEEAEKNQEEGEVIVVIARGQPTGTIIFWRDPEREEDEEFNGGLFYRDAPPFQGDDWAEEDLIVPPGTRFLHETWNEYRTYLHKCQEHFPEYLEILKAQDGNPVKNLAATLRRIDRKVKSKKVKS